MKKKNLKKKYEFQENLIKRQFKQIEFLKNQIEQLKIKIQEKNELINSIIPLKNELAQNIAEVKKCKEEYQSLIKEIKKI